MFVNFNDVFHPSEEKKRLHAKFYNEMLSKSFKNNGECCCNCKHSYESHIGHDIMLPRCRKTKNWIKEDIKCEHYVRLDFIIVD